MNFGELRRSTDRHVERRAVQLELAVALMLVVKLTTWARRWKRA